MRLARTVAGLIWGALWVLALATDASAQPQLRTETPTQPEPEASSALNIGGYRLEGEVRAGVQGLIDEPSHKASAKFDEYRDIHTGVFLDSLRLRLFSPDEKYYGWLAGSKWGRQDQEYSLEVGRVGLWEAQFDWVQTPHVYSRDTARLLAQDVGRNVFVLPLPRPLLPNHNAGQVIDQVGVLWRTARLSWMLTPTPEWELKGEYTRIHKEGTRAIGISYQTPMNNFAEFLEPIDQLMHDIRIGGTYAQDNWQVQFGYVFSMFQNFRNSVTGDNPCFGLAGTLGSGQCQTGDGTPGTLAVPAAEPSGRVSLAPSNMAHTVTVAGGISLPMRTRVNVNVSYSLRLQNDEFLPHTNTQSIANDPAVSSGLILPNKSLDGVTGVFLGNLFASTRPIAPLTLSFKYRILNLHDMSNAPLFPCGVESDSSAYCDANAGVPGFGPPRQAKRREFTTQNAEINGRWRFGRPVSATLGLGWEGWDRNATWNVTHSDEPFAKAVVEVKPADWLLGQLTYRASFRRNSNYNPYPTHIGAEQAPRMRKFDVAERDRQQVDLTGQVMATDTFSVGTSGSWRFDNFVEPQKLGVQTAVGWSAGLDASWRPDEQFSISAGYVHESNFTKQLNQTMNPTVKIQPTYEWLSDNADTIDTYHLNLNAAVIPRTLDYNLGFSYATAVGSVRTRNTNPPPSGGGAAQNRAALAQRWPTFEDELLRIDTGLTYYFWKGWSAKLSYAIEQWSKGDFRTAGLDPYGFNRTPIFLGEDYKNYTAHIVGVTLGYRFK